MCFIKFLSGFKGWEIWICIAVWKWNYNFGNPIPTSSAVFTSMYLVFISISTVATSHDEIALCSWSCSVFCISVNIIKMIMRLCVMHVSDMLWKQAHHSCPCCTVSGAYCIINALHVFMSHLSTLVGIFNALVSVQNTDIALAVVLCHIVQVPSLKVTM